MALVGVVSFIVCFTTVIASNHQVINSLEDFPYNEDNRLSKHYFVYQNTDHCVEFAESILKSDSFVRQHASVSNDIAALFFGTNLSDTGCAVACLEIGSSKNLITEIFPEKKYFSLDYNVSDAFEWYASSCQMKEVGFAIVSEPVKIYWVGPDKKHLFIADVEEAGDHNALWVESALGHVFEAFSIDGSEFLGTYHIEHDSIFYIGEYNGAINDKFVFDGYPSNDEYLHDMFYRMHATTKSVQRTFTKVGFDKGKLPRDLFNSLSTYYYNNRNNLLSEANPNHPGNNGINFWQQDVQLVGMPYRIKV